MTLSDKILFVDVRDFFGLVREGRKTDDEWTAHVLPIEEVREAIQKLKDEFVINHEDTPQQSVRNFVKLIDSIFGDALVHTPEAVKVEKPVLLELDTPDVRNSPGERQRSEASGNHSPLNNEIALKGQFIESGNHNPQTDVFALEMEHLDKTTGNHAQICECGHEKKEHYKGHVYHVVGEAGVRITKCKKFTPKGCAKRCWNIKDKWFICGEIGSFCSKCKTTTKNHAHKEMKK